MEGKELYSNEDEELNPRSENEKEDADDFGLPEIEESDKDENQLGDPYSDSSSDDYADDDSADSNYSYDDESEESDYQSSYDDEERKSPVGWIILIVILMIAVIATAIWWWFREPAPDPLPVEPVVEQPIEEPEPEIIEEEPEPEVRQAGVYNLSAPTGNYHVIAASSIDVDLVTDYANKLAKQGMVCQIIAPRGSRNFHRLSVAEFPTLGEATVESERLKGTLGEDVWVIRY